jgi:outer membrane protein assembly factor BamD (BamD/ComL family)
VLRDARSRLHSGDLSGAFARLETSRTWFPHGRLVQEREALTVELLFRSGQHGAARQRAQAFVKAFPRSAFAPHMRRMLEQLKQP